MTSGPFEQLERGNKKLLEIKAARLIGRKMRGFERG